MIWLRFFGRLVGSVFAVWLASLLVISVVLLLAGFQ